MAKKVNIALIFILVISLLTEGLIKLCKYDLKNDGSKIIDENDNDREIECFNIFENTVIFSSISSSEKLDQWDKSEDDNIKFSHTIGILNSDDSFNNIMNITSSNIYSIDISKDGTKGLILGDNINSDVGFGIYELDFKEKSIKKLLLDSEIINKYDCKIKELTNPYIVRYSRDENIIYFTGTLEESESFSLDGIEFEYTLTI